MKNRINPEAILVIALFLIACVLGIMGRRSENSPLQVLHVAFNDSTPMGGKGLRLLMEHQGYSVKRADALQESMPADAKAWLLLDPSTKFSQRESDDLLKWVEAGGTLIWALGSPDVPSAVSDLLGSDAIRKMRKKFHVELVSAGHVWGDDPLPTLSPINQGAVSVYWSGVKQLQGSQQLLTVDREHLEIAGNATGIQMARIPYGKGRIIVASDALFLTNYALSKPDNAVFASNLVGYHLGTGGGTIYFDERSNASENQLDDDMVHPSLLYYLWRPPLRYAVLQLLCATLLAWMLYGRRLGAPIPLPEQEPVTRASQFAMAMGGLFQKARRPQAAAAIIAADFRRRLTHSLGLTPHDEDSAIAARAAQAADLPQQLVARLLERARHPSEDEAEALSDAQEMENVLTNLEQHSWRRQMKGS